MALPRAGLGSVAGTVGTAESVAGTAGAASATAGIGTGALAAAGAGTAAAAANSGGLKTPGTEEALGLLTKPLGAAMKGAFKGTGVAPMPPAAPPPPPHKEFPNGGKVQQVGWWVPALILGGLYLADTYGLGGGQDYTEYSLDWLSHGAAALQLHWLSRAFKWRPPGNDGFWAGAEGGGPDVTKRPSKFRKKTLQDSWENATPGQSPGTKKCATCDNEVEIPPNSGQHRDWDNDHFPKWKDRDLTGKDRGQVLDEYNRETRLRCRACNRKDN